MRKSIPMLDFQIGCIPESVGRRVFLARAPNRREGGRLSFLRHDEIYRSDVGRFSLEPKAASRWSAPGQDQGRKHSERSQPLLREDFS